MTTAAQRQRSGDAGRRAMQELREFKERRDAAKARCDAIIDLEELADSARDYLLAVADVSEYQYGLRADAETRAWRRRANNEGYRQALAIFWIAERLKKRADAGTWLSAAEQKAREDRDRAESEALRVAIDAMLRKALS